MLAINRTLIRRKRPEYSCFLLASYETHVLIKVSTDSHR